MLSAFCVLWKGDCKGTSLMECACDRDITAMGPGNGPGQTETQSDACLGPALIAPVESLKNAGKIIRRYSASRVFDRDDNLCIILRERETFTDPPEGVYLMALSRRLESIR